jgi:hypothetical protein
MSPLEVRTFLLWLSGRSRALVGVSRSLFNNAVENKVEKPRLIGETLRQSRVLALCTKSGANINNALKS